MRSPISSYFELCVLKLSDFVGASVLDNTIKGLAVVSGRIRVYFVVSSEWGSKFPTMIKSMVLVGSALEAASTIIFAVTVGGHWGVV